MRVLLVLFVALSCNVTVRAEDGSASPTTLKEAFGHERILGRDYLSDVVPSTSPCLGRNDTLPCAVDTLLACWHWRDPQACLPVRLQPSSFDNDPMVSTNTWGAYSRYRYTIKAAVVLAEEPSLPWLTPAAPGFEDLGKAETYDDPRTLQEGDVMALVSERNCLPGGEECVATMAFRNDVNRDICVRIEPCYGLTVLNALLWRHGAAGWQFVQAWRFERR